MGCKFKYNGQTYESEADLKAVLRQELKANTAKVRDGDKQTTQPTTNTTVKSGVEISSNAKGLAAALTNPTELAKYKGNLTQSYPITFRGKTYIDSEAAYQALKSTATKDNGPNNTYNLMVDIIKTKLEQYPRLVTEIINQGGSAWILNSTHQPTRQNNVWETGGKNWFIKALNDAYIAITSSTTQQPIVDEITIQKMTEIMKEIYPEADVTAVTDQSQFAQESKNVFNQTFRNATDFGVAINRDGAKLYQSIYHILPNVNDAQLEKIYDNYVNLMSKNINRKDSAMSYEIFISLLDSYQVFNYKDTYIFGQYNFDDNVFVTRVNSSPTAKELLAEALPIISKNFDVISFVPEDLRDKYVRSGYISSEESYPYDFKGEKMFKYAVVSNSNVAKRVFGTDIKNVNANSIEEYNNKQSLKSNYTFVKGMKGIELLSNIAEKMYILAAVRFRLSYEQENNYYSSRMRLEGLSNDEIGYVFSWIKRLKIEEANSFNEIFAKIQLAELQGGVLKDIVNITDVANNALNTKLQNWVSQYGVEVKSIDEYKKRTGKDTLGAADVLNKVIYYNSENANVMDFPEDVAHFYIEMMGIRHPLIKDALNKVATWSEYSNIFEQYKEQYTHEDGTPDILRIKKVAISRAIATRLVGKSKIETSAFWALIDEIIQKIKAIFKGDISKFNLELIADELAEDILSNTGKYLGYGSYSEIGIPTNFELKSYEEAMKKAPHLQKIVDAVSSMGGVLTGSLSYRKQGTTYRKTTETIHDLDFTIPYNAYKDQGSSQYIQTAFEKFDLIRAVKPGSNEYLAWTDEYNIYNTVGYVGGIRIKDWKAEGYYNQGDVLWFDKNKVPLNEPRLLETGELAFDGTSIDFFFLPEDLSSSVTKTTDNLAFWTVAFDKKIQMGRDKDAFDYRTFIPLPEYREGPINNSHLYSKNSSKNKQQIALNQKKGNNIVGQAQFDPNAKFMAGKVLIDYINGTVDTVPHEYAHLYIAWFRNTPLVQEAIKQWESEEALVQAIGEQAVVQRGKAWTWWKKFLAWLLNSANELSDLSKTELRNILTDAFLSRQDITATVGKDVYKKDRTSGEWVGVDPDNPIVYPSDAAFKEALDAEQAIKVKNDAMIKPAWKNNKRAALENRLLDMHKAIALHPVNAQNLLAPVSTVITKGIVEKLGIRAKHKTRGAVIDPLSNINASIAMVQGKQGVGIVANAINTKAALTGVDAKLTLMYPVQSPLSNDEKHIQLPINLRMLGIEKVEYADGTLAYSLGKLVDTFGNSIIANLSESLTQQVDNVKDPVAVELGYTLKTLGLTSYVLTLGVPQEVLAGLTAKGGVVTAWNDRVEENENLFHKGVTEESYEVVEYTGEPRKISTRFEESNSTLKIEFINSLLRKQPVPSKYIETVVDNNGRPKGHILKHEALDTDNVSLDKYDAVKLLFYWELIDQARAYGNTIKALTADTKTHKSIDAAAQQQLLINQQLQGVESIVDKDDISKVISSKAALKSNTKSVISPFFNMQRKYGEYFSKYFYTHENGISAYLAASLKARYKLYSGDKLNRLISTAHNDFMIYLMTRMTAVNPNTTSSLAKFNNANAPLVGVDALLKHGEGLKMSAVNSIYNNLTLISKQPNITASRAYYYAQPTTVRNNNTTALYQNVTPEMARALLDIFRFELGRVIKADVNIDNNVSIYLQNIPSIDLIMFKDSAITTSAANNYIEIFEELRTLSPKLIQLFNSISLFQAGLNNSPYNLFKTLPITDLLAEDKSKSLVSNLATTIKTFDKLLPKKDPTNVGATFRRDLTIQDMVDDFLRWFDLQYGKIYVQLEAASKYNKASMLYRKFDPAQQKFLIYVKPEAGGDGNPLASVSSLTKNYLSTVPYTYAPTTTAVTNSNVITNDTINEDATIKQLESLGAFGDIIKWYVAAGGEIETLCS